MDYEMARRPETWLLMVAGVAWFACGADGGWPGVIAATLPGGLMLTVYLVSKRKGYGRAKPGASGDGLGPQPGVWESFKAAILPLMLPVLILGGIYGGVFTPTEAAAAAVCFALIIGVVVFRTITVEKLVTALRSSLLNTVVILLIISAASVFGWVLTANRIPELISQVFVSISDNPLVFLLLINLLLLLVGMFLETGAAITVLAPILTPVALKMGIDPIHFGILMIVNLAVGMTTPPVGVNLFVACQIAGLRIEHIIRSMLPFYLSLLICLAIITYLPGLSLWLPQLLK